MGQTHYIIVKQRTTIGMLIPREKRLVEVKSYAGRAELYKVYARGMGIIDIKLHFLI